MRALTLVGVAAAAGAAVGAASRFVAQGDARRAAVALLATFGVAVCSASGWKAGEDSMRARLRRGALVAAAALVASWAAAAASGSPACVGAATVVAGAAATACGVAMLARARGVDAGRAAFIGAAVPSAAAAALFVADPFVEWNGSQTQEAPARAAALVAVDPVASIAADVGVDFQRSTWMYAGPAPGTEGLSVVGRYYPSSPTPAWRWGLAAAGIGFAALALARRSGTLPQ